MFAMAMGALLPLPVLRSIKQDHHVIHVLFKIVHLDATWYYINRNTFFTENLRNIHVLSQFVAGALCQPSESREHNR